MPAFASSSSDIRRVSQRPLPRAIHIQTAHKPTATRHNIEHIVELAGQTPSFSEVEAALRSLPLQDSAYETDNAAGPSTEPPRPATSRTHSKAPSKGVQRALNAIPLSYRDDAGSITLVTRLVNAIHLRDLPSAWSLYQHILHSHPLGSRLIPARLLHGLTSLLWKSRPVTRQTFLRLVSVTSELRATGHNVYQWEWNALIHAAGAGLRKPTTEDYDAAMGIVQEMLADALKDAVDRDYREDDGTNLKHNKRSRIDVVTLNTLLAIASRTGSRRTFARALDMLQSHSPSSSLHPSSPPSPPHALRPDRITHLILLNHHAKTGALHSIPQTLQHLVSEHGGIGVDGVNAALWAYGKSGQLDIALKLYDRLRRNVLHSVTSEPPDSPSLPFGASPASLPPPPLSTSSTSSGSAAYSSLPYPQPPAPAPALASDDDHHPILSLPGIAPALAKITPDRTTYIALIQCLAYWGDFEGAISVFRDMIGTRRRENSESRLDTRLSREEEDDGDTHSPSVEIYRSIFLGFTRYGVSGAPPPPSPAVSIPTPAPSTSSPLHPPSTPSSVPHRPLRRSRSPSPFSLPTPSPSPIPHLRRTPPRLPCVPPASYEGWTLENLEAIFETFLDVPLPRRTHHSSSSRNADTASRSSDSNRRTESEEDVYATSRGSSTANEPPLPPNIIYWALIAFARTSPPPASPSSTLGPRRQTRELQAPERRQKALMGDAWFRMAEAFNLAHPARSPLPASSLTADVDEEGGNRRYRVRGRLKRLVEWLEQEDGSDVDVDVDEL